MKKRVLITIVLTTLMLMIGGCGSKILHCDGCGVELKVKNSSNMEEDWIILCNDCEEDAFGETPLIEESN